MSPLEINDYYHDRAVAWLRANKAAIPRLYLGKLIRAFIPIPWIPTLASYAAFSYRFLLDVLFLALAPWWWGRVDRRYLLFLSAMFVVNLVTVVVYWGVFRFTHVFVEIFFILPILIGAGYLVPALSRRLSSRQASRGGAAPKTSVAGPTVS
jgi:hypothetical protein